MSGFTLPCDAYEPGLRFQAATARRRHAAVRPVLFAGSLAALATAVVASAPSAHAAAPADGSGTGQLAALRACESGGNYATDTGNGYYGAYQFDLGTWQGLGFAGLPSQASPATQDAAVVELAQRSGGWSAWPVCGAGLGAVPTSVPAAPVAPAAPSVTPEAAPAAPAAVLTLDPAAAPDPQLETWQQRMLDRGWPITVDGVFGPQTQQVATAFAAEKQITEGLPGEIGPQVWAAAWTDALTD